MKTRRWCQAMLCAAMLQLLAGCDYNSSCGRLYLVEDVYCCPDGTMVQSLLSCPADAGTAPPDAG